MRIDFVSLTKDDDVTGHPGQNPKLLSYDLVPSQSPEWLAASHCQPFTWIRLGFKSVCGTWRVESTVPQ